jgi:PTS system cellobiose-specific IIA component
MNELDNESVKIATQVIINSGNARELAYKALDFVEEKKFDEAEESIQKAKEEVSKAHQTQTDIIHAEARGEDIQLSLLLTHAQDSLMIAMSEVQLIGRIIRLFKKDNN